MALQEHFKLQVKREKWSTRDGERVLEMFDSSIECMDCSTLGACAAATKLSMFWVPEEENRPHKTRAHSRTGCGTVIITNTINFLFCW